MTQRTQMFLAGTLAAGFMLRNASTSTKLLAAAAAGAVWYLFVRSTEPKETFCTGCQK